LSDCYAALDCSIVPDDLEAVANDGGVSHALVGFRPLKIYVEMLVGTSTPDQLYTYLTGGPDVRRQDDAGTVQGMSADGGVALGTGCAFASHDLWGSCAHPTGPLCGTRTDLHPSSCRDYPQSGYVVTCCP
jgi:hypothetical protein